MKKLFFYIRFNKYFYISLWFVYWFSFLHQFVVCILVFIFTSVCGFHFEILKRKLFLRIPKSIKCPPVTFPKMDSFFSLIGYIFEIAENKKCSLATVS